jgi:hypothetical protein
MWEHIVKGTQPFEGVHITAKTELNLPQWRPTNSGFARYLPSSHFPPAFLHHSSESMLHKTSLASEAVAKGTHFKMIDKTLSWDGKQFHSECLFDPQILDSARG